MERILVRKLHVDTLIQILTELYENGVEFVDLYTDVQEEATEHTEEEDSLGIHFCREYMHEDFKDKFEGLEQDELSKDDINVKLSDDDLNELL